MGYLRIYSSREAEVEEDNSSSILSINKVWDREEWVYFHHHHYHHLRMHRVSCKLIREDHLLASLSSSRGRGRGRGNPSKVEDREI